MARDENVTRPGVEPPEQQASGWKNIGKLIFMLIVLVAAWFLLEWLFEGL